MISTISLRSKMRGAGGVGIIVSLMVLSVVTSIAVKHSWRSELDLTRASHRWVSMQAGAYIEGAESLAVIALAKDQKETKVDSLNELWAMGFDFPTDHGAMSVEIVDAQSRLNINTLAEPFKARTAQANNNANQPGHPKYHPPQLRFIRLLQMFPIDDQQTFLSTSEAEAILEAVKDWVDTDSNVEGFGGAEADYYSTLEPPITITNGAMISITELRRVRGMTPLLYRSLLPFVSSLPASASLNVNTMGPWLARTMNIDRELQPLTIEDGARLFSEIVAQEPEDVGTFNGIEFVSSLFPPANNNQPSMSTDGLVFTSAWFDLRTTVTVGDYIRRGNSRIQRPDDGQVRVVRRSDSHF